MCITKIATLVWEHNHTASFGGTDHWPDNFFTKSWGDLQEPKLDWRSYKAGWYWFLVKMSQKDLLNVQRPSTLPQYAGDIGILAQKNFKTADWSILGFDRLKQWS